jgi:hypothetical protein
LLKREGVFLFIFEKFGEIDSEIENEMLVALSCGISERTNKDMVLLMRFLHSSAISRAFKNSAIVYKAKETMQHLYGVQSSTTTNTSATNIPTGNTSSEELCSFATDDMTLLNELQNAKATVSVVQMLTSKTAKEFEFRSL